MSAPASSPHQRSAREIKLEVGEYGPFFEGDILMDRGHQVAKRMVAQDSQGSGGFDEGVTTEISTSHKPYWPNGVVPFRVDSELPLDLLASFTKAMHWWEQVSCVRFVYAVPNETAYINLTNKVGCSSYVGRIGKMQEVSIGIKRCRSIGNAAHELGHALGFWHEHTRTDRNDFVRVEYSNIAAGYGHNFEVSTHDGVPNVGYDFESIMHYDEDAFTRRDGLKTIVITHHIPDCMKKMGQRLQLSYKDSLRMNKLYNCTVRTAQLEEEGNKCPLTPPPPAPTPKPASCRKIIKSEETLVMSFVDPQRTTTEAPDTVGCTSRCGRYSCGARYLEFYGPCIETQFKIYKVVNGKNKNVKSGDPVALESLYRANQWFDCRKGNCTLTSCATDHSNSTPPVNITQRVCINHRLRMFAVGRKDGKSINTDHQIYFKHLEDDKYLNCLGKKGCRLITEGNCSGSTSASGSSGAGLCERQFFTVSKQTCKL